MTNKYMYFIANWKMFGVLNSLNTLNRVVKFFKNFKKKKVFENNLLPTKHFNRANVKKIERFKY